MKTRTSGKAATGSVIVALPHKDDPVHALGPEPSHVTLAYLGDAKDHDPAVLSKTVADVAARCLPIKEKVAGKGALGADSAYVLHLDGQSLAPLREDLLQHPNIAAAHAGADQFPTWNPHLTVGYPDDGDSLDALSTPQDVSFDRVALWHGDQQVEHKLGVPMTKSLTASASPETIDIPAAVPWHGVWAVEGCSSGDSRFFAINSLTNRALPLPLTWQKASAPGHQGEVKVGVTSQMARVMNTDTGKPEIRAGGFMLQNTEGDEVVGEMAAFGKVDCSVGVDSATFSIDKTKPGPFGGAVEFSSACITACAMVITGAFADTWISLGEPPEGFFGDEPDAAAEPDPVGVFASISDSSWDGSASRFTPEQWKASCILHIGDGLEKSLHKLPIREPGGALSRAGVHAAAGRLNQVDAPASAKSTARGALRRAYSQLNEDPPTTLAGSLETFESAVASGVESFNRGPGWVTDPAATRRIHSYWTTPGQPGYAKIDWGKGGDFNRCRTQVGEEIGESSPEKLRFINQICAQWHKDALGYYPSTHAKMIGKHAAVQPLNLVASTGPKQWVPKKEWFANPNLTVPTPLQFEDHPEGTRVYGHYAEKGVCHLDFPGICVTPPPLLDAGANFMDHRVLTDDGIVFTGHITLGGGHADLDSGLHAAKEHYDDVTSVFCDVIVGEDDIGFWFSGWLRPDHNNEAHRFKLFAAQLSGDWREKGIDGQVLIGVHAVNTGGFALKPTVHFEDGRQTALVAAGGLAPRQVDMTALTAPDVDALVSAAIDQYEERRRAQERVLAAASAVGATPEARLARVRESITEEE